MKQPPTVPALPPRRHVLVAEDNDINRRLALFMLQKLGLNADFAGDGQKTILAWEKTPYLVILMDCHMPVMDGYMAARKIRELEKLPANVRRPRTHIIAMTANALLGAREKCLEAGMDDYISKPVRLEVLQAALAQVIDFDALAALAAVPDLDQVRLIEDSVAELQGELGSAAVCELLECFRQDTPVSLAELATLSAHAGAGNETFARAAHSLAGSCSIFGLDEMRRLALELETCALQGEHEQCAALLAALNQIYAALSPALERLHATVQPATS